MKHWLKRALITAALACGALVITAGTAHATAVPVDLGEIISQTQEATNTNETTQTADASAETYQVNVYAPVAILSHDSNNGDVDQSNEAETKAEAENDNATVQVIDQDQKVKDGDSRDGYCGKCRGSDGDVNQEQTADNSNTTDQDANASAETNQTNVYAPVAILSHDSNNGDVDQSNEAETKAEAENDNATVQVIDQDQKVEDGDSRDGYCGKCGGSDGNVTQSQSAENSNWTEQNADATATTDQENLIGNERPNRENPWGAKGAYNDHRDHNDGGDNVDQSNEAETTAKAENDNSTVQVIDQDQKVEDGDSRDGYCGKCGGSDGNVTQSQSPENSNWTEQDADATATTDQENLIGKERPDRKTRWAPKGDSHDGKGEYKDRKGDHKGDRKDHKDHRDGSNDIDQSNEANTKAEADNDNSTAQLIDQDQIVSSWDGSKRSCKCRSGEGIDQTQDATNTNDTTQTADATAETNQTNVYAPDSWFGRGGDDVDQSNDAYTGAFAGNDNITFQLIDQFQMVGPPGYWR